MELNVLLFFATVWSVGYYARFVPEYPRHPVRPYLLLIFAGALLGAYIGYVWLIGSLGEGGRWHNLACLLGAGVGGGGLGAMAGLALASMYLRLRGWTPQREG